MTVSLACRHRKPRDAMARDAASAWFHEGPSTSLRYAQGERFIRNVCETDPSYSSSLADLSMNGRHRCDLLFVFYE